jgi:hypothetical protein
MANNDFPMILATIATFLVMASVLMFESYGTFSTNAVNVGIQANLTNGTQKTTFCNQSKTLNIESLGFASFGSFLFIIGLIFIYSSIKEIGKEKKYKKLIIIIFAISVVFLIIFWTFSFWSLSTTLSPNFCI